MRKRPHHASSHIRGEKEWQEFLEIPWTTNRTDLDMTLANETGRICQQNFTFNEVNSCLEHPYLEGSYDKNKSHWSAHTPFYEMRQDGSGQPFNNILEMRSAKILNFLQLEKYQNTYAAWHYQYEYLLQDGTEHVISRIENATGVQRSCTASPPQPQRPRSKRLGDKHYIDYMNEHVDWEIEKRIGYKKWKV
eukprot:scaffold584450_cov59-Attheya_sp.AAC.1